MKGSRREPFSRRQPLTAGPSGRQLWSQGEVGSGGTRKGRWGGDFPSEADPWTVRIQALNSLAECVQLSKEQMALN